MGQMDFDKDNNELAGFISSLTINVLFRNDKLENYTKWLQKLSELEGFDYQSLYEDLSDFFEMAQEYRSSKSMVLSKSLQLLAKRCFVSQNIIDILVKSIELNLVSKKHTYPNGDHYEGFWCNNRPEGIGVLTWFDGTKYEGNFENGLMNGFGIMKYCNGNTYSGQFSNGHVTGMGVLTYSNNMDKYVGPVIDGIPNGMGALINSCQGIKIEGIFINGVVSVAKKIQSYSQNIIFEGEFYNSLNGKFVGYGIAKDQKGNIVYEGDISRFF